jgi:hypothetical protein
VKFLLALAMLLLGGSAAASPSATGCRDLAFASVRHGNIDISSCATTARTYDG